VQIEEDQVRLLLPRELQADAATGRRYQPDTRAARQDLLGLEQRSEVGLAPPGRDDLAVSSLIQLLTPLSLSVFRGRFPCNRR
jgi:hypothetical protein